jgi:hypothetical protein
MSHRFIMDFLVDLITIRWRRREFEHAMHIHPATQSKLLAADSEFDRPRVAG